MNTSSHHKLKEDLVEHLFFIKFVVVSDVVTSLNFFTQSTDFEVVLVALATGLLQTRRVMPQTTL